MEQRMVIFFYLWDGVPGILRWISVLWVLVESTHDLPMGELGTA